MSNPVRENALQRFIVTMHGDAWSAQDGPVYLCVTGHPLPEVQVGDELRLNGTIRMTRDAPAGPRIAFEARDCAGSLFAESIVVVSSQASPSRWLAGLRERLGAVLHVAVPGDAGVLLSGLVTGDDAGLSSGRRVAFVRTGTTHLTAVSGSNLALVVGFLATVGSAALGHQRFSWRAMVIAGVWGYALVTGAQAPVVRAAIVATAAIIAFQVGRRPDFPTLVMLAAGGMAVVDPGQVDGLGFRLSVASSLALAVVLPAMTQRGRVSMITAVLSASLAAQIATLPFLIAAFGTVSIVSLPANVLVAPLVLVAMPLAASAGLAGLASQQIASIFAAPAALAAAGTLAIVDAFGAAGGAVQVGVPQTSVAMVLAATSVIVLLLLSSDASLRFRDHYTDWLGWKRYLRRRR